MRQSPCIRKSVDLELPLLPCAGSPHVPTTHPQPSPDRGGRFARRAVAGAILVAATGCATHDANPSQQFRIEPVFSVSNSAQSAESSQAYYTLGKYFDNLHEWGRAVDAYRQSVAADTHNIEALNALGVALAQGRHFAEAEAMLRQAVALAPERTHIRNNLGYVLLLENRPADAMSQLKVAVSQGGNSAIAMANLRDAMARAGVKTETADAPVVALADTASPIQKPAVTAAAAVDPGAELRPVAAVPVERVDAPAPVPAAMPTAPAPVPAAMPTAPAPAEVQPATAPAVVPTAAATATVSPATNVTASNIMQGSRLEVSNGNGMNGMAARVGHWLTARGVPTPRLTNQQPYAQRQTVIQFRSGHEDAARRLAGLLPASAQTASQASTDLRSDVRVVLGRDWVQIADCLAHTSCQPAATTAAGTPAPAVTVVAQR